MAQIPNFKGESWLMYAMVAGTLVIVYLFPKITKAIPSPLVAIIVMTAISAYTGINIRTVGDMGNITRALPIFHIPSIPFSLNTLTIIFPYAVTLSLVGILESLLTATILDDMTDSKSDKSKEVVGQGIANLVSGFFGGMAGCAMIGQSVINIKSGGKTRLSTFISGIFLMILIICLGDIVKAIPMAALVGVMIMVSISTFEWKSIKNLNKMPFSCAAVMITTMTVVVLTHNLAQGVLVGIAVSAVMFAWKITEVKTKIHTVVYDESTYKIYRISGQLFFASTSKFIDMFGYSDDPQEIIIDFKNSHIWDHSAINAISKVKQKYIKLGKKVSIVGLNKGSSLIVVKADEGILEY